MTSPIPDDPSLDYASDDNYTTLSDPYDGTPVKVAPSAGVISQGQRPGHQAAAQWWNAIFGGLVSVVKNIRSLLVVDTSPIDFTAVGTTTWVCPDGLYAIRLQMCGAGGGGAGGGAGTALEYASSIGGGGGGAAVMFDFQIPVTPGVSYDLVLPAGGAGGTGSTDPSGTNATGGADGGNAIFKITGGATLATAHGGGGAPAISENHTVDYDPSTPFDALVPGGKAVHNQRAWVFPATQIAFPPGGHSVLELVTGASFPGDGGDGVCKHLYEQAGPTERGAGWGSLQDFGGGAGGGVGTDDTLAIGGGPGGGGGGGPFGAGGFGGSGGNASAFGTPGVGTTGHDGDAASGAGGGGGGGGGSGTSPANGGDAGAGGSGRAVIYPMLGGYS